jgi:hypothetical protein
VVARRVLGQRKRHTVDEAIGKRGRAPELFGWQIGTGDQVKGKNRDPGRILWNIETPDVKGDFAKFKAAGATVVQGPYLPQRASARVALGWHSSMATSTRWQHITNGRVPRHGSRHLLRAWSSWARRSRWRAAYRES